MGTKDPRVDAYVEQSADFAKPILTYLRAVVHEACPDCAEEIKWRFPHFSYKGMFAGMAAFKQHCTFGFWKGSLVVGDDPRASAAMGQLGRITSLTDLPPRSVLINWIKRAVALNDKGVKVPRERTAPRKALSIPADLGGALKKNRKAGAVFAAFSPTKRRDYIEWIIGAKTDQTRKQRLATAVTWIAEGKSRNWKYEKR